MSTLSFGPMVVHKRNKMKENHTFWSNGPVQIKEITRWGP